MIKKKICFHLFVYLSNVLFSQSSKPDFNKIPILKDTLIATKIVGPAKIIKNTTIATGSNVTLSGEFLIAANIKITVPNGALLIIEDAHLYAFGSTMWQGIEVKDGGKLICKKRRKSNLIEDAITAIDAPSQATTTLSTILSLANTTFNKNYKDINFANYPCASNSYSDAITLNNCVFTCRDFTFNATTPFIPIKHYPLNKFGNSIRDEVIAKTE